MGARRRATLALALRADVLAADVLGRWRAAGIPAVLLRGPVIARRLYDAEGEREYADCDVLVAQRRRGAAEALLARAGFELHPHDAPHSRHWVRASDGAEVDLHRSLDGADAQPDVVWRLLAAHARPLALNGVAVEGLDSAGVGLVVALHAAQHGRLLPHPMEDLRRAVERIGTEDWRTARELAADIGAAGPFADALGLLPEAAGLRAQLGLREPVSARVALRAAGRDASAVFAVADAVGRRSGRARTTAAARLVVPPVWFMREHDALARRGRLGLLAAYVRRPLALGPRMARELVALRRARRSREQSS